MSRLNIKIGTILGLAAVTGVAIAVRPSTSLSLWGTAARPAAEGSPAEMLASTGSVVANTAIATTPSASPTKQQSASTISQGQFVTVDQSHPTAGTARITSTDGQRVLTFDSGFTTARGPAVEVLLYRGNTIPVAIAEGDYISLAPLQSFDGAQSYVLPDDIDLSEFGSVGIWCRRFNVTFGYASW